MESDTTMEEYIGIKADFKQDQEAVLERIKTQDIKEVAGS
jgi:hypothetical protein